MPRNVAPLEQNTFVAGLVTEASPLTFPPNASLDEENFNLNRNGSRSRRLGFDLEDNYVEIETTATVPSNFELMISSFKWQNVGGNPSKTFIVIQIGKQLSFFDSASTPLSAGLVGQWDYDNEDAIRKFSYASVDGMLVVVTGRKEVDTYEFDGTNLTKLSKRLKIRDLFGVTDVAVGE
jgi:hypothetical protein